jgi:hypothetical protein
MTWFLYVFDVVGDNEPDSSGLDPTIHAGTQGPAAATDSQSCKHVGQPL